MYTREQYEQDRRNAIESGIDPRLIMSYSECLAWDAYQAEKERDESRAAEFESEPLSEFDAYGVEERDELLELVEMAEESALSELGAFGSVECEIDERMVDGDELEAFWEFAEDCGEYIPFGLFA